MKQKIADKLQKLPTSPGVYFHKDSSGEIIYVGKAANLRNRVRQYFQKSRLRDPKTDVMLAEIADVEWTEVETEVDALFLEAELVRRYLPRYNILLRDDKSQLFVRIDYKSDYPTVTLIRRPLDDGAEYFGPYINSFSLKKALRYLRRAFPYAISKGNQKRASLHYHLGLDPGLEEGRTSLQDYRANLRKLMQYLKGNRVALMRDIEKEMKKEAKRKNFEKAAVLRNQLNYLQQLSRQIIFSDREIQDASRDEALVQLKNLLGLAIPPRRIEGFDISHIQGTDTTASMVVFADGLPHKAAYRKFKMRLPGNDDFAHMKETLSRRLKQDNVKKWGKPDLILIDGGKGQLAAGLEALAQSGFSEIPAIGLAKREEEIIIHKNLSLPGTIAQEIKQRVSANALYINESEDFLSVTLSKNSELIKLLQRIRDESHRFAVTYHGTLRAKRQTSSVLDEIPGIGPATRKKLIRYFGSLRAVTLANKEQIAEVIGDKKAAVVAKFLNLPG